MAALASVATSPARWRVDAPSLPALPSPATATRVVVHASSPPVVTVNVAGETRGLQLTDLGGGDYEAVAPAGARLVEAYVSGRCKMHLVCTSHDCDVPPGTAIAVTRVAPIATWRLEATSPPQTTPLTPDARLTWVELRLSPTGRVPTVRVDSPDRPAPSVFAHVDGATLMWEAVGAAQRARWTAHVAIEGPCPSTAPCLPPPGTALEVLAVERHDDAP